MSKINVSKYKQLIATNKLDQLFDELSFPKDKENWVIMLLGTWNDLKEKENLDLYDRKELRHERANLKQKLLKLVDELEKDLTTKEGWIQLGFNNPSTISVSPFIDKLKYAPYLSVVFTFVLLFTVFVNFANSFKEGNQLSEQTQMTIFYIVLGILIFMLIIVPILLLKVFTEKK